MAARVLSLSQLWGSLDPFTGWHNSQNQNEVIPAKRREGGKVLLVFSGSWFASAEANACQNYHRGEQGLVTKGHGMREPGLPFLAAGRDHVGWVSCGSAAQAFCQMLSHQAGSKMRSVGSSGWSWHLAWHPKPFPGQSHVGSRVHAAGLTSLITWRVRSMQQSVKLGRAREPSWCSSLANLLCVLLGPRQYSHLCPLWQTQCELVSPATMEGSTEAKPRLPPAALCIFVIRRQSGLLKGCLSETSFVDAIRG